MKQMFKDKVKYENKNKLKHLNNNKMPRLNNQNKITNFNSYGELAKIFPIKNILKNDNEYKIINKKRVYKKNEVVKDKINKYIEEIKKNRTQITLAEKHKLLLLKSYKVIENHKNPKRNQDNTKLKDVYEIKDETNILLYKTKIKNLEKEIKKLNENFIKIKNIKNINISFKNSKIDNLREENLKYNLEIIFSLTKNNLDWITFDYKNYQNQSKLVNSFKKEINDLKEYILTEKNNYLKNYNNLQYEKNNLNKLKDKFKNKKENIEILYTEFKSYLNKLEVENISKNDLENELNINKIREQKVEDLLYLEKIEKSRIEDKLNVKNNYIDYLKEKIENYLRENRRINSENKLEIENLKTIIQNKLEEKNISNKKKEAINNYHERNKKTFKNLSIVDSHLHKNLSFNEELNYKPLLRIVSFDEIKNIIDNLRYKFMSKNISINKIIEIFKVKDSTENDELTIDDVIEILRKKPFNLKNEEHILLISRYIIEDNCMEKIEFDLKNNISFNIAKSIIRSLFKNYNIYDEKITNKYKLKLKEIILPHKKKIISTFTQIMNIKNDVITINSIKENFLMNEIELETDIFNFLVMTLFKKSKNIENLSIKECFLFIEN